MSASPVPRENSEESVNETDSDPVVLSAGRVRVIAASVSQWHRGVEGGCDSISVPNEDGAVWLRNRE